MRSKRIELKLAADLLSAIDKAASTNFENRSAFIRKSIALRLNEQHIVIHKPKPIDWKKLMDEADDEGV